MKNQVTVSELKKQLEMLEQNGMGDYSVWYRDRDSMDYEVERGLWDICERLKSIALG